MTEAPLLRLLHLCDSLFPLGGFAHSDGLEAATASGAVTGATGLRDWMGACLLENLERLEGPAVCRAWQACRGGAVGQIRALDDEVHALRPSSTGRQASRAMGARLLKTWHQLHPSATLASFDGLRLTLPVAFGLVCASAGVDERSSVQAFFYTRLAATVSAAMRLMSIGQNEAHALLAGTLETVPERVDRLISERAAPSSFMPAVDIAAMSQQYVYSRLFRS